MITADTLATLTTFTPKALSTALADNGYKGVLIDSARFLGMTNGGEFCYSITFSEDSEDVTGKVFLMYDPITGVVKADY
jgi:hypothetical protein